MSEVLRNWVLGIVGAALMTALSMALTPEGKVKRVVTLTCGAVTALMLIGPLAGINFTGYAPSLDDLRREADDMSDTMLDENEKLSGIIIEERCAAYILDKGTMLGIDDLEVSVTVEWGGEGYWYPTAARLKTNAKRQLRDKLGEIIITDLGIRPDKLDWSVKDDE